MAYKAQHGDCNVPTSSAAYRSLAGWIYAQRQLDKRGHLSLERRQRLEALGFLWNPGAPQQEENRTRWEAGFTALQAFYQREGHWRVPVSHRENGYPLGTWVTRQRFLNNKGQLLPERLAQMQALKFEWSLERNPEPRWEAGFTALQAFYQREGHWRVPVSHREGGYPLGYWVTRQRQIKDRLSPEQRARLETLGFIWDARDASWETGFMALQTYHQREGHCRVPLQHHEEGYPLGRWVALQHYRKGHMSPEQRTRLEGLGFVWPVYWEAH